MPTWSSHWPVQRNLPWWNSPDHLLHGRSAVNQLVCSCLHEVWASRKWISLVRISLPKHLLVLITKWFKSLSRLSYHLILNREMSKLIAKAAGMMTKFSKNVWDNQLILNTKFKVNQACVLIILLYSSESNAIYARLVICLENFYHHCL